MGNATLAIIVYVFIVNIWAILITIHDKNAARRHAWRTRESTLLLISALGGSVAMLVTMRIIRHKTKHPKFMVGIPVIIILQILLVFFLLWKFKDELSSFF